MGVVLGLLPRVLLIRRLLRVLTIAWVCWGMSGVGLLPALRGGPAPILAGVMVLLAVDGVRLGNTGALGIGCSTGVHDTPPLELSCRAKGAAAVLWRLG